MNGRKTITREVTLEMPKYVASPLADSIKVNTRQNAREFRAK
jgi:hypothetical protein